MKTKSSTYTSSVYQAFCAIEPGEYRERIRFVEKHRKVLQELDPREYLGIMVSYSDALFEIGKYHKQVRIADHIAELSIQYNIEEIDGRDVYFDTLFKKAASLHNLLRLEEAIYIIKELIKMNPDHESSRLFLINCYVLTHKKKIQPVRGISVALILLSAFVIAVELLAINPFFPEYHEDISVIRNTLFISGIVLLVLGEVWLRYRAVDKAYTFSKMARKRKNSNSGD